MLASAQQEVRLVKHRLRLLAALCLPDDPTLHLTTRTVSSCSPSTPVFSHHSTQLSQLPSPDHLSGSALESHAALGPLECNRGAHQALTTCSRLVSNARIHTRPQPHRPSQQGDSASHSCSPQSIQPRRGIAASCAAALEAVPAHQHHPQPLETVPAQGPGRPVGASRSQNLAARDLLASMQSAERRRDYVAVTQLFRSDVAHQVSLNDKTWKCAQHAQQVFYRGSPGQQKHAERLAL